MHAYTVSLLEQITVASPDEAGRLIAKHACLGRPPVKAASLRPWLSYRREALVKVADEPPAPTQPGAPLVEGRPALHGPGEPTLTESPMFHVNKYTAPAVNAFNGLHPMAQYGLYGAGIGGLLGLTKGLLTRKNKGRALEDALTGGLLGGGLGLGAHYLQGAINPEPAEPKAINENTSLGLVAGKTVPRPPVKDPATGQVYTAPEGQRPELGLLEKQMANGVPGLASYYSAGHPVYAGVSMVGSAGALDAAMSLARSPGAKHQLAIEGLKNDPKLFDPFFKELRDAGKLTPATVHDVLRARPEARRAIQSQYRANNGGPLGGFGGGRTGAHARFTGRRFIYPAAFLAGLGLDAMGSHEAAKAHGFALGQQNEAAQKAYDAQERAYQEATRRAQSGR